jgi:hypothetical protein
MPRLFNDLRDGGPDRAAKVPPAGGKIIQRDKDLGGSQLSRFLL